MCPTVGNRNAFHVKFHTARRALVSFAKARGSWKNLCMQEADLCLLPTLKMSPASKMIIYESVNNLNVKPALGNEYLITQSIQRDAAKVPACKAIQRVHSII